MSIGMVGRSDDFASMTGYVTPTLRHSVRLPSTPIHPPMLLAFHSNSGLLTEFIDLQLIGTQALVPEQFHGSPR